MLLQERGITQSAIQFFESFAEEFTRIELLLLDRAVKQGVADDVVKAKSLAKLDGKDFLAIGGILVPANQPPVTHELLIAIANLQPMIALLEQGLVNITCRFPVRLFLEELCFLDEGADFFFRQR